MTHAVAFVGESDVVCGPVAAIDGPIRAALLNGVPDA